MLLERAAGLADRIEKYQKLKSAAKEAELVSTRAAQVKDVSTLLAQAKATLDLFSKAGISIQFFPANAGELIDKAKKLKSIAAEAPAELATPPFNVKHEFTDRVKGLVDAVNRSLEEGWQRYVAQNTPSGSEEVLEALSKLPQMRAGITRIRQCRQKINFLVASVPSDPESAIKQLRVLTEEHSSAWAEITADSVPMSVLQFLRLCASEGASITSLTKEVREWLEARELLGSFRIRIG